MGTREPVCAGCQKSTPRAIRGIKRELRERQRKEERETDRREEIRLACREQDIERVNECENQNKKSKRYNGEKLASRAKLGVR